MNETFDGLPLHRQSFASLAKLAQKLRDGRVDARDSRTLLPKRIALLGGFTTSFVTRVLDVFLCELGIDAEIYESPYASLTEHVLNPGSELYAFAPDITLLLVHHGNLDEFPGNLATSEDAHQLARREAERWATYAEIITSRISTRIIQSNFELPSVRPFGNYEATTAAGAVAFVRSVNAELAKTRSPSIWLFDLEYVAARYGLERALDAKSYCLTKQPFSFDFLVPYCHALSKTIALACGLSRKCVVLDLDGTLWGGTLAEDGIEQLVLGPDSAEGEAFHGFQRYLKQLKDRGVLLAVCSKNDETTARNAFRSLPHMVLALDDIACFVANWEHKAGNIVRIAQALNIGLDSLVFVDNSPEERHLVRQSMPEVSVPELPEDPADYARTLDEGAYFEISELTAEALLRTQSLVQNRIREDTQGRFVDYDAYLRSLHLQAKVQPIAGAAFERCAELILRSNQFNLRTLRHSEADLRAFLSRPDNVAFCVSLEDRFGQYGIISVVLLERASDAIFIDTWLMSCRVLKKGVEVLVFQEIVEHAKRSGLRLVRAEYRPTAKNAMVATLLPSFGFERVANETSQGDAYHLNLDGPLPATEHFIRIHRATQP